MAAGDAILPSSFRDPSGFVFLRDGVVHRQVNLRYKPDYDRLLQSGLHRKLVDRGLLVAHEETSTEPALPTGSYLVLRPEAIPFISYPYEWSFGELKDAARITLEIQQQALDHGMSLKDASAYNVQFRDGKPVFIDTLSFEAAQEGKPWVAYRQFCQHFLAPLALMAYVDLRASQLLRVHLDGIPLDLASALLPARTRLRPSVLLHVHLHARAQKRYGDARIAPSRLQMSRTALRGLVDNLRGAVERLECQAGGTVWADYYSDTNYTSAGLDHKKALVGEFLEAIAPAPREVWDLGANTGLFSRIASERGMRTVAWDADPLAVERNYRQCVATGERNLLPLVADVTNPSPGIGWENRERLSLVDRGPVDVAFALALIHHLAIAANLPLGKTASFFRSVCRWLIVEFVPKHDSQVQRLLASREDIFTDYTQDAFEHAFAPHFTVRRAERIRDSERTLYLMQRRA